MRGLPVSAKFLFAGLFLVVFSSGVFSAPLEVTGSDTSGFDGEVTGGENLSVDVNFTNSLDKNLTFLGVLKISSEEVKVSGKEFTDLSGDLNGMSVGCIPYEDISRKAKSFACSSGDFRVARPGLNSFSVEAETSPYIYPARYDLKLDIRSVVGNSSPIFERSTMDISKGEFDVPLSGSSRVSINSSGDARLMLMNYTELTLNYPTQDSEHLESLMIEVFKGQPGDPDFGEVDASGSLNLSYPERLDEGNYDLGIYYYNDSDGSWENVTDLRDRDENYVYAEVSHFSTYSVFATPVEENESGEEQQEEDEGDEGQSGGFPPVSGPNPSEPPVEEPADNNGTDQNDSSQDQPEDGQDQTESDQNETDQSQQEETVQDESDSSETSDDNQGGYWFGDGGFGNLFTGLASEGPGNVYLGFMAVLIAVLSVLQYTGRIDFIGRVQSFSR